MRGNSTLTGVLILVLNFSVTLSLEAKLHLLHSYMNVKWITLPCDMQVTGPGVFSSLFNYSEPPSAGQQRWAPPWLALLVPASAALGRETTRFLCPRFSQSFSCPFLLFVALAWPAGQLLCWWPATRTRLFLPRQTRTVGLGHQKLPQDPRLTVVFLGPSLGRKAPVRSPNTATRPRLGPVDAH